MHIHVEFFGIPRERAGVSHTVAEGNCLGDVLEKLAAKYPKLQETCIEGRQLKLGYTANLGGEKFITDPETQLNDGDTVLLLALDAGG